MKLPYTCQFNLVLTELAYVPRVDYVSVSLCDKLHIYSIVVHTQRRIQELSFECEPKMGDFWRLCHHRVQGRCPVRGVGEQPLKLNFLSCQVLKTGANLPLIFSFYVVFSNSSKTVNNFIFTSFYNIQYIVRQLHFAHMHSKVSGSAFITVIV